MSSVRNVAPVKYYYAKLVGTSVVEKRAVKAYEEPVLLEHNIRPLSGKSDFSIYGSRAEGMYRALVANTPENIELFTKFSLAYLEGSTPSDEFDNGDNATHFVTDVRPINLSLHIYFERLPSRSK